MSYHIGDYLAESNSWSSGFLDGNSTAFYLMPFRVFEFGIGGLLIFIRPRFFLKPVVSDFFTILSLLGLFFLMVYLTEGSVFPFYNALFVVILTSLLILCADNSKLASIFLANPVMVFIGGISYSLYLVHWPLIVYYKALFGELYVFDIFLLLISISVLGYVLHVFVENRFRRVSVNNSNFKFKHLIYRGAIFLALVFSVALVFVVKNFEGRIPDHRLALSNSDWRKVERQKYCSDKLEGFPKSLFTCQNDRGSENTVVIWGDSHALHLVAGMSHAFPKSNIAVAYLSGCISQSGFHGLVRNFPSQKQTEDCVERNKEFLNWSKNYKGDAVIYISNAKRNSPEQISSINNSHVEQLEKDGHIVHVLGDFIRPGVELAQCYSVPNYLITDRMLLNRCQPDEEAISKELRYSEKLALLSKNYIPVHVLQCSDNVCRFSDDKGRVSFRDTHHLSPLGAIYWLNKLKENGDLL